MAEKEKTCARRKAIVAENRRRLEDMHPKAPKVSEKTLTIEGLIPICEPPVFVVTDDRPTDDDLLVADDQVSYVGAYLCARCKLDVGGALEKQGATIKKIRK